MTDMQGEAQKLFYRELLRKKLDTLVNEGKREPHIVEAFSEKCPDPSDRATVESEMDFNFTIRQRKDEAIRELVAALDRIDRGIYGICDECEEEIPKARLDAVPGTRLCVDCMRRLERT